MEVTIEKLVYGGDGLSRQEGTVVFTPYVLPQERVQAEVTREKPGLLWTRLTAVLEPSPDRVPPACPYFTRCGGCHYQHAPYANQLEIKRGILIEALQRVGKIEPPADIAIVSADPWHYRNRSQFHVSNGRIGYLEARSHKLCPVETCPISSPKINETLAILIEMARDRRWPAFLRAIEIFTNETAVQISVVETDRAVAKRFFEWCAERIPGFVPGALEYQINGDRYQVSGGSFFQVNRYLAAKLVETALDGTEGNRARAEGRNALDLYAGVGLFSVPLARRFRQVTAVESGARAIRDLRANAEHVTAVQANAQDYLQKLTEAPDFVLLDPPRAGLGKEITKTLATLKPPAMVIVSCDPATLARDLAALLAAGYKLEKLTLVDLFPQTYHLEAVARLNLSAQP